MTNTFREHFQRAIFETCDLWDICSELWEKMIWPKKDNDKDRNKDRNKDKDKNNDKHPQMKILEKLWNCWHFWQLRTLQW